MFKARIAFGITLITGLAAAVEPLKLEDYVPSDFRRTYLSVEPRLNWGQFGYDFESGDYNQVSNNSGPFGSLGLNYGSERFTQNRRWTLSSGLNFEAVSGRNQVENHQLGLVTNTEHSSINEDDSFRYKAFTRLSGQQYLIGRFFLKPSLALDWDHTPASEARRVSWSFTPALPSSPIADDSRFIRSRSEYESYNVRLSGATRLEAGFGRIQDVRFAETGLFILDRIAATTGKPLALDAQGMRDLEAAVEARRQQRAFLDKRGAAIYDLETVAVFLQERRGGEALPVRTVLEMADEWRYGGFHERKSGWEARVYPFAEWHWRENEDRSDLRTAYITFAGRGDADPDSLARIADGLNAPPRHVVTTGFEGERTFGAGARLDWHRPWMRYWQFNAMAYCRAARVAKEFGETRVEDSAGVSESNQNRFLEFAYPAFEAGASFEAAWYPDSRTALKATAGFSTWLTQDYLGSNTDLVPLLGANCPRKTWGARPALRVGGEYWVNPRVTGSVGGDYGYEWSETQCAIDFLPANGQIPAGGNSSRFHFNLNAALKYYLF